MGMQPWSESLSPRDSWNTSPVSHQRRERMLPEWCLARTQRGLVWEPWHRPPSQHCPQEYSQHRAGSPNLTNVYARWPIVLYRFLFVLMSEGTIPSGEEGSHSLLYFHDHCGGSTVLILAWGYQSLKLLTPDWSLERECDLAKAPPFIKVTKIYDFLTCMSESRYMKYIVVFLKFNMNYSKSPRDSPYYRATHKIPAHFLLNVIRTLTLYLQVLVLWLEAMSQSWCLVLFSL